ncbi:hypothetical protein [Candidatus Electronema sp. JM]
MRAQLIEEIDEKKESLRFYFLGANVAIDQEGPLFFEFCCCPPSRR